MDPLRWTAVRFLNAAAVCLGLGGCQTVVAPPWSIPQDASTQTVNGYPLAYATHGSGPTIVFVHAVLADYRYGQQWLDTWSSNFRVIAVSLRHFYPEKWNGKGSDFTVHQHADDLIAFIETMGGPVYLVGWSYGGGPAYEVARARPDLVKKLKCLPQAAVVMITKAGHPSPSMNPPAFKEAVVTFLQR